MMELTDRHLEIIHGWVRPLIVRDLWRDWWRMVRLIHRGPKELRHCEAIEAANSLFGGRQMYMYAMRAWADRDHSSGLQNISLRELPQVLVEHRMRRWRVKKPEWGMK